MSDIENEEMRLQKFLSRSGVASRRASEKIILARRVKVNGKTVDELGVKVIPSKDIVEVDERPISLKPSDVYMMLYKPSGYVTTMEDPQGRPCVRDIMPLDKYPSLFPVGRLDMDTTGLLLFTSNGEVAQTILHPKHEITKHYVALVEGKVTDRELDFIRKGIELKDGMCAPANANIVPFEKKMARPVLPDHIDKYHTSVVELVIHEGRKRQVKRMLSKIGHPVINLHRDRVGPILLSDVKYGCSRHLSEKEVEDLLRLCK